MMFGERARFAVEAECRDVDGRWVFGGLRFWVAGLAVGDWDDSSELRASARWGRTFLRASPRRTRIDLDDVAASVVYERLYGRFVVPANAPCPRVLAGVWDRDPFVFDEVGESSTRDECALVVVRRGDGADRFLVKWFEEGRLLEVILSEGECDRVVDAYCSWVEGLRGGAG